MMTKKTILVTGSAGFIGRSCMSAWKDKYRLIGIDNLVGVRSFAPPEGEYEFFCADVRNIKLLPLPKVDAVVHLAAQTAVTLSESSPSADFANNIEATMRLIERFNDVPFIYSSTNKVYGELEGVSKPIDLSRPIDPKTPYGVTKAAADLLIQELVPRSICLRQSCIYGEQQNGTEDQGWVSHLLKQHSIGGDFTIFGDGNQIRDLLHVDDLITLYSAFLMSLLKGWKPEQKYFVVGGGVKNALSVNDALEYVGFTGKVLYGEKRNRDQDYFVSANEKLGWIQSVNAKEWLVNVGNELKKKIVEKAVYNG
jgi:CDP-paratose 2-epimerase